MCLCVCSRTVPTLTLLIWNSAYWNDHFSCTSAPSFCHLLQASVKPKCGRLVGFSSGGENPHGVKAVTRGQRCAVALWFTLNPLYRELVTWGLLSFCCRLYIVNWEMFSFRHIVTIRHEVSSCYIKRKFRCSVIYETTVCPSAGDHFYHCMLFVTSTKINHLQYSKTNIDLLLNK